MNSEQIKELNTKAKTKSRIRIQGKVINQPEPRECKDRCNLWQFMIRTNRKGKYDELICMMEDRLYKDFGIQVGQSVRIEGEIRAYRNTNSKPNESKTIVYVFVKCIIPLQDNEGCQDINEYTATGMISSIRMIKEEGEEHKIGICEFDIAVVSKFGNCFYIPCVAWGLNADYVKDNGVGNIVQCIGRFQSRKYKKIINDVAEERIFYEVAIRSIRQATD